MTRRYEGGCLCGKVRYAVQADPINERVCHCRLCQKAVGATFNGRLLFHLKDVELQGRIETFNSSAGLKRGFCPECGTTLLSIRDKDGVIGVTAGTLDDPSLFRPSMHIWTSSRQPWLKIEDGLPQYPEGPPA